MLKELKITDIIVLNAEKQMAQDHSLQYRNWATPQGAVALLREFLRKKQGIANPSAALLKALLIAGAKRLPGTAPSTAIVDNHQGFGRVNVDRSVKRALATLDGPALKTGTKSTWSGASTDVVAHESGHALLDQSRPDLWDSSYPETNAFHEAFGDCMALLTAFADPATRTAVFSPIRLRI